MAAPRVLVVPAVAGTTVLNPGGFDASGFDASVFDTLAVGIRLAVPAAARVLVVPAEPV